jgi:hypothetical protein
VEGLSAHPPAKLTKIIANMIIIALRILRFRYLYLYKGHFVSSRENPDGPGCQVYNGIELPYKYA